MQSYGYDAKTGEQLWVTDPYTNAWGMYTSSVVGLGASSPVIAYGRLYTVAYDGTIHCYNMTTGQNEWNYYIGNAGYDTPYGTWPFGGGLHVAADGKIYATTGEHSPSHPLERGAKLVCVNATTGDEVWRTQGWLQTPVIADGSLTAFNHYDNRIYCFNKGPTKISVSAPDVAIPISDGILIKGTVVDISPGTKGQEQAMRFPDGVPAVSDSSMSDFMAYVYQQQAKPANTTGVTVNIDVIDSNNNFRNIGQTTADANGFFSFNWKPDIAGTYTVIANFPGSQSYWPSHSQTAFSIVENPSTQTPAPTSTQSAADMYFIPAIAGIIIVIIVMGAAIMAILLRRRP
jgi:outer membrane protein assembly factor BamB